MKKILISALLMISLTACGGSKTADVLTGNQDIKPARVVTAKSILDKMETAKYKEGELLVKFRSDVAPKTLMKTHEGAGSTVLRKYEIVPNLQHVKLPAGISVRQAVESYMTDPNVEYAEPNYVRCASAVNPADTYFTPQQWALYNTGTFAKGTSGSDIKAREAWELTQGNRLGSRMEVVVAVLDSGIDYNHPDLVSNIWTNTLENRVNGIDDDLNGKVDDWRGWNFVDNNNDPMDDLGHGTHVAGIIGAQGNNNIGIAGVMWNVKIMPLKIFQASSEIDGLCSSAGGFVSDEIAAIQYVREIHLRDNNLSVINASFHTGVQFCNVEYDAIRSAGNDGVLFIAAAGNGGDNWLGNNIDNDLDSPASYFPLDNVITVAATDQNDRLATFSNYGPKSVHIAAPGVNILSTVPTNLSTLQLSMCSGSGFAGYDFCDGTSMAAPHVAGVAGLIYSYYNKDVQHFDYRQVRGMILRYVDTVDNSSIQNLQLLKGRVWSNGRLNAWKAISSLLQPTELTATPTNTTEITLNWKDNATGEDYYIVERRTGAGAFSVVKDDLPFTTAQFVDKGLTPGASYEYRVKAMAWLPNPPNAWFVEGDSFYSNTAEATTPTSISAPPASSGGGGCSIGPRQNRATAAADFAVIFMPLFVIAVLKGIRRRKK